MMLTVDSLGLQRGRRWLLCDLSFAAEAGSVTVVMGPNGAGKSSLLLALAGLLPAGAGTIRIDGRDLAACARAEVARLVAWQGEFPPAEFGLTVQARLALAAMGVPDEAQLTTVVEETELAELLAAPLGALSSGERQRVELAALMLRDAPVWLLDEPAAHLDLRHQVAALAMLRRAAAAGRTIVVVLHDIQQALSVADRVVLLAGDGTARTGTAAELLCPSVLESVFGLPLLQVEGADGQRHLMPRYRE